MNSPGEPPMVLIGKPVPEVIEAAGGPAPYYEAAAVIGVEIDPHKLYREVRKRGCQCYEAREGGDEPPDEWQCCPYCGKALWDVQMVTIPEWDSTDPARVLLAGLLVVTTANPDTPGLEKTPLGREVIRAGVRLVVGEYAARTDFARHARMAELTELASARERLKAKLEPLKLWDDKKFGVWAVLNRVR